MAYRIATDLAAREEEWIRNSGSGVSAKGGVSDDASTSGVQAGTGVGGTHMDEEEAREAVFHRLEALGYRVGLGVAERYAHDFLSSIYASFVAYSGTPPPQEDTANIFDVLASPAINLGPQPLLILLNSSAKTSGNCFFASKSITSRLTTAASTS